MSIRLGSNDYFDSRTKKIDSINKIGEDLSGPEKFLAKVSTLMRKIFVCWRSKDKWEKIITIEGNSLKDKCDGQKDAYNKSIDDHVNKMIQNVQQDAFDSFMGKIPNLKAKLSALKTYDEITKHQDLLNALNAIDGQKKSEACEAFCKMIGLLKGVKPASEDESKDFYKKIEELINLSKDDTEIAFFNAHLENLTKAMKDWNANAGKVDFLSAKAKMIPVAKEWAAKMKAQRANLVTTLGSISKDYKFKKHGFFQDRINEAKKIAQAQQKELEQLDVSFANYLIDKTNELLSPVADDLKNTRAKIIDLNAQQLEKAKKDLPLYSGKDKGRLEKNKDLYEKLEEIYKKYWKFGPLEAEVKKNTKAVKKISKKINKTYSSKSANKLAVIYATSKENNPEVIKKELMIFAVQNTVAELAFANSLLKENKLKTDEANNTKCNKVIALSEGAIKKFTELLDSMETLEKEKRTDIEFETNTFAGTKQWCKDCIEFYKGTKTKAEQRIAILEIYESWENCRAQEKKGAQTDLSTKANCDKAIALGKDGVAAFKKLVDTLALVTNKDVLKFTYKDSADVQIDETFDQVQKWANEQLQAYETAKVEAEEQKSVLEGYELLAAARAVEQQNALAEPTTIDECNQVISQAQNRIVPFQKLVNKLNTFNAYKDKFKPASAQDTFESVEAWGKERLKAYETVKERGEQQKLILECIDFVKDCQAVPQFVSASEPATKDECDQLIAEAQKGIDAFQKLVTGMGKIKDGYQDEFSIEESQFAAIQRWSTRELNAYRTGKEKAEQRKIILDCYELAKPCSTIESPVWMTAESTQADCNTAITRSLAAIKVFPALVSKMRTINENYREAFKFIEGDKEWSYKSVMDLDNDYRQTSLDAHIKSNDIAMKESLAAENQHASAEAEDKQFMLDLLTAFDHEETNNDGNCFFHAIKKGLEHSPDTRFDTYKAMTSEQLRVALYEEMKAKPDDYSFAVGSILAVDVEEYAKATDDQASTLLLQKADALKDLYKEVREEYKPLDSIGRRNLIESLPEKYMNSQTVVKYADAMANNKTYVGLIEAYVMSKMLKIQLSIHSLLLPSRGQVYNESADLPVIHIYRPKSNAHFELLVEKKGS